MYRKNIEVLETLKKNHTIFACDDEKTQIRQTNEYEIHNVKFVRQAGYHLMSKTRSSTCEYVREFCGRHFSAPTTSRHEVNSPNATTVRNYESINDWPSGLRLASKPSETRWCTPMFHEKCTWTRRATFLRDETREMFQREQRTCWNREESSDAAPRPIVAPPGFAPPPNVIVRVRARLYGERRYTIDHQRRDRSSADSTSRGGEPT